MLNYVIAFSLRHRLGVLFVAVVLSVVGTYQLTRLPVDVFPDLNRPTVTILTEAAGLAPEEVEQLVSQPLEALLNGATGVRRVRSASAVGLSIVWVEFDWNTDVARDRQVVTEKLQLARERLPRDVTPTLAPVASIMGEIMLLGLRPTVEPATPETMMELRTLAEFPLRNRLLAVEGVAQVTVIGGTLKQYQVLTSPARLAAQNVTLQQLTDAAGKANAVAGGGVVVGSTQESVIRISGRSLTLEEVAETPVLWREPRPVLIKDVADVRFGGPPPRGDASVMLKDGGTIVGGPAVVLTVQKQPDANTLVLDRALDQALDQFEQSLPANMRLDRHIFRQSDFIRAAVDNVVEAVRDGAIWVFVILVLFLGNFRTSLITLTALPLSVLTTVLAFTWWDVSINTMTLGGIAVAVGELVDDAIVDVENISRRLREERQKTDPAPPLRVIFLASSEVRGSVVYATLIVCTVVAPLFALSGLEGRMFAPLGLAYITALAGSLLVSLTVTPALASVLLPRAKFLAHAGDPLLLRWLKWLDGFLVRFSLRRPWAVVGATLALAVVAWLALLGMGSEFLPTFNEGTLTVNVQTEPGTNLAESNRVAGRVDGLLLDMPEVVSVTRRTGRAEMDEHAEGVHSSEIDVRLAPQEVPRPGWLAQVARWVPGLHGWGVERVGRPRAQILAEVRERVTQLPNVHVNVGQPIEHRLDHVLSGVRAQIAIKVFGPDLHQLRELAEDVQARIRPIPGVVDLLTEPQAPQLRVQIKRQEAARYGLAPGDVARFLETAYKGLTVSEVLDRDRRFNLVVWFDEAARSDPQTIGETVLETPSGRKVSLGQVAEIVETIGPNTVNREHVERRIAVACNVQGRDLGSVVGDVRRALAPIEERLRQAPGYRIEYGGQFEAQQEANVRLALLGTAAIVVVFALLWACLGSWVAAGQVLLVNIPLAAVGAVMLLLAVNWPGGAKLAEQSWWHWPETWAAATTLSLAHWVGFITLIGIVSRNGILMIAHYLHLMRHEGETFGDALILRGTLERLAPVLMTALVAVMGLVPLALRADQTGKEILHPLALVVIGGLLFSTLMDQMVTPAVFALVGRTFGPGVYEAKRVGEDATQRLAEEWFPAAKT